MKMLLNNGIFYEFIPFTSDNFDEDGQLLPNANALKIDQVEEDKPYALLISTNSGAWRYMIGDVIAFKDVENCEIIITGRTKHFLSLCGEHLSVDNMNTAIETAAQELNIDVKEFTVVGEHLDDLFAHRWYIGTDDTIGSNKVKEILDEKLKEINDDYCVERKAALKDIHVEIIPTELFYEWMKMNGKEGGQNKFPRVLKSDRLASWEMLLDKHNLVPQ